MMSMDICHDSAYDENKFLFHNSKYEDSLILNSFVSEWKIVSSLWIKSNPIIVNQLSNAQLIYTILNQKTIA